MRVGQGGQRPRRVGRAEAPCRSRRALRGPPELGARTGREVLGGLAQEVSLGQVQGQRVGPGRDRGASRSRRVLLEARGVAPERGRRAGGGLRQARPGHREGRHPELEEGQRAPTLPAGTLDPRGGGVGQPGPGGLEKPGHGAQARRQRLQPLVDGREIGQEKGHGPEHRFRHVKARIPNHVPGLELPGADPQRPHREAEIERLEAVRGARLRCLLQEDARLRQRRGHPGLRRIRKPVVVLVHADEGRRHRMVLVVPAKEAVEPGRDGKRAVGAGHAQTSHSVPAPAPWPDTPEALILQGPFRGTPTGDGRSLSQTERARVILVYAPPSSA